MNATLWIRIASVVSLVFAAGHTLGGKRAWSPVGESDVLTSMRTSRFVVQGVSRSYLDFYRGFGFSLSVFLLLQAVVLWQLAAIATAQPLQVRPIVASFALASLGAGIIAWFFIFPVPALLSAILTACLVVAFFAVP